MIKTLGIVTLGLALGTGTTVFMLKKTSDKIIDAAVAAKKAEVAAKIPDKPWDFWTIEMENLANDLKGERQKIKQREERVLQDEARLRVEQQELEKTRKQIENLRAAIDQRLIEVTEGEMGNLKRLSLSYSALTPRSAVAIFKEMDDGTLVKLLSIMKPETVGAVLEEMSRQSAMDPSLAKRAAVLSEKLRLLKSAKPAGSN
jgi:flagellar motility protein MotE (MotC chaperone)